MFQMQERLIHLHSYIVPVEEMFEPKIDNKHTDYIWSDKLPEELLKQTTWV